MRPRVYFRSLFEFLPGKPQANVMRCRRIRYDHMSVGFLAFQKHDGHVKNSRLIHRRQSLYESRIFTPTYERLRRPLTLFVAMNVHGSSQLLWAYIFFCFLIKKNNGGVTKDAGGSVERNVKIILSRALQAFGLTLHLLGVSTRFGIRN